MEEEVKKDDTFHNLRNIGISFIKEEKNEKSKVKEIFDDKDKDKDEFKKQYHKDIENYEKDLSTNPQDASNLKELALLYKKIGKFDKSIEYINKLLVMEPENEDYKKDKVSIEELKEEKKELKKKKKEKNYPEVEALCKKILEEAPQAHDIQNDYIDSLIGNDKYHELTLFLKNDISEENKNLYKDLNINYNLGLSLAFECEFEKAKELLNKAKNEEIKDDDLKKWCDVWLKNLEKKESLINKGEKLIKEKKYKEAIEFYDSKLEKMQNSNSEYVFISMLLSKKAFCYYQKKEYDKALKTANESVKKNPNYSYAYVVRDMIKAQMEKKDSAKTKEIDSFYSKLPEEIIKEQNQGESSDIGAKGAKKPKYNTFFEDLPCAIKLPDKDKEIVRYNKCFNAFNKDSEDKFKVQIENKSSREEVKNKEINKMIKDDEISLGLSIFGQGVEGKLGTTTENESSIEFSSIVAKHVFYSITIKEEKDITFTKEFYDKIEKEVKPKKEDEEKAKELEKIFKETGIYVPLKFSIGGLFEDKIIKTNVGGKKANLREISANINLEHLPEVKPSLKHNNSQESNINSLERKTSCIGGTMNLNYEEWAKNLKISNSNIIGYSEFREIFDFLNDDLKKQLKEPIDIIKKKYRKRINYEKIINRLKHSKGEALLLEDKNEYLPEFYEYVKNFKVERGTGEKTFHKKFTDDKIIGLSIILPKNQTGNYSCVSPLLKDEIKIKFEKSHFSTFYYEIFVRIMKCPE